MRTTLKIFLVLFSGCCWMLFLCWVHYLPQPKGFHGFPSPVGEILTVLIFLGIPFAASMVMLHRSFILRHLSGSLRWTIYSALSVGIAVALALGGSAMVNAFDSHRERGPGHVVFTEEEVRAFITPGRSLSDVTNRFGEPVKVKTNGQYLVWRFRTDLPKIRGAPSIEIAGEKGFVFAAFTLRTSNGVVVSWMPVEWAKTGK